MISLQYKTKCYLVFLGTVLALGLPVATSSAFGQASALVGQQPATGKDKKSVGSGESSWNSLQPDKDQMIANFNIVEILRRYHYNSQMGSGFRQAQAYDSYLKILDPNRSYFIASDIAAFNRWRPHFNELIQTGNLQPGFIMYKLYLTRAEDRINYVLGLLNAGVDKLDFSQDDYLDLDREKALWPENRVELNIIWLGRVKDEVLRLKMTGKEDKAIQDLLVKRYQNQLKRLDQIRSEDIFQTYINAYAETFDPHTEYMSPENAENFDISMSLSLDGIGALLKADNEYVKVVRLITAGPAEKGRLLKPADRIVGVAQDGKEMVDVIGWRLDEVVKLIRGPKGSKVHLEIIPAGNPPGDLTTRRITLTREAVKLEEQAARKDVINLKYNGGDHKVGVIYLPTFYVDFKGYRDNNPNYKSSTKDVRRLIDELRKERVEGIILDIRNNGGGSLQEASMLTNLFVSGPTVQVRGSDGRVDVMEDDDGQPFYQGPLVIMVNRLSASASEIFAGAMQDYHRALIVGSQTFGKGTVQTVQPLNHGELKYTLAKFYRVSGESTQNKGVVPDIHYPSLVDMKEIGESALPEAMPWDTIPAAVRVGEDPLRSFMTDLRQRHEARVAKDPDFVFTREQIAFSKELGSIKKLSLNEQKRQTEKKEFEERQLAMENQRRKAKGEEPLKKLDDKDADTEALAASKPEEMKPQDDAYLMETAYILLDSLGLQKAVATRQP